MTIYSHLMCFLYFVKWSSVNKRRINVAILFRPRTYIEAYYSTRKKNLFVLKFFILCLLKHLEES